MTSHLCPLYYGVPVCIVWIPTYSTEMLLLMLLVLLVLLQEEEEEQGTSEVGREQEGDDAHKTNKCTELLQSK